jgi:hypothetical protein
MPQIQEDAVELVPVPMSAETRRRLVRFAAAIGKHPTDAAAELFAELLHDDAFWNAAEVERSPLN